MREHFSIITNNWNICYNCGKAATDCHHMLNGSSRSKSDIYGLVVPMCHECHMALHNNPIRLKWYKQTAQREFEKKYSREKWMIVFHKNYLE